MFCRVLFLKNFAHDATFDFRPAAVPDTTVSPHTRESDVQRNEAVQNTVPEVGTCTKSPAKSLPTPLDNIIKELKDCREQWLQAQSQLDHSATKAKEMEGQVARLRAAHEGWCFNSSDHVIMSSTLLGSSIWFILLHPCFGL